ARVGLARVLYTPGEALPGNVAHKLDEFASPGCHSLCRSTRPGCEQRSAGARSSPAASRTSWCSSLLGGTGLSSPLPGVIVFVGAPAPGAHSVVRGLEVLLLHRGRAGARPS